MECSSCHKTMPDDARFCPYCGKTVPSVEGPTEYEYSAFISYRHLPRDQEVAKRVQKAIETFKMPRGSALENNGHHILGKCFRDEDELSASHSLPDRILDALKSSSALVVICTPDTKESVWVRREIEAFIEMHGQERVFAVLADGSSEESIPELLRIGVGEGGASGSSSPLAADMRPEASKKQRDETLRLIAGLVGCGYDDLKQRDRVRRRKQMAIATVAVIAVVVAIVGAIVFASNAHRNSLIAESHRLAGESTQLLAKGDRYGAIEKALEALPASESSHDRPLVEDARQALVDALEIEPSENVFWRPSYLIELEDNAEWIATEPKHNWFAVMDSSITVSTFDYLTGKKLASFSPMSLIDEKSKTDEDSKPAVWRIVSAEEYLIVTENRGSGILACYEARTGKLQWVHSPLPMKSATASSDGRILYLVGIGESELYGIVVDVDEDVLITENSLEIPSDLVPTFRFYPIMVNGQGLMHVGVGDRVAEFDFTKENWGSALSDSKGLDITSINQAKDSITIASASVPNKNATTSSEREREYRFECLDQSMNTLWSYGGTWSAKPAGEGFDLGYVDTEPKVHGIVYMVSGLPYVDQYYVVCTVGNELLLFEGTTGELAYSEQFSSPILFASPGTSGDDETSDTFVVVCADGTVAFRYPFIDNGSNPSSLGFTFPNYVFDSRTDIIDGKTIMAIAVSLNDRRQIVAYHVNTEETKQGHSADSSASSHSLDELIPLAHETLVEGGRE